MSMHARRPLALHSLLPLIPATLLAVSATTGAETTAAWDLNDLEEGVDLIDADLGEGRIDLAALVGAHAVYEGTDLNGFGGGEPGSCFGVRGSAGNGSAFELVMPVGEAGELSFAYRATTTGFDQNLVQRWNGTKWSTLSTFGDDGGDATEWKRAIFSLSVEEDGIGHDDQVLRLRVVLDGAESANGVIRFDNLQVSAVPAPTVGSIAGLGGLLASRSVLRRD